MVVPITGPPVAARLAHTPARRSAGGARSRASARPERGTRRPRTRPR